MLVSNQQGLKVLCNETRGDIFKWHILDTFKCLASTKTFFFWMFTSNIIEKVQFSPGESQGYNRQEKEHWILLLCHGDPANT